MKLIDFSNMYLDYDNIPETRREAYTDYYDSLLDSIRVCMERGSNDMCPVSMSLYNTLLVTGYLKNIEIENRDKQIKKIVE